MIQHIVRTRSGRASSGFTLTELAIVLVVIALLVGGLMGPLFRYVDQQRYVATNAQLDAVREVLVSYAAANGRLPCPAYWAATGNSGGTEVVGAAGGCGAPTMPVGTLAGGAWVGYVPAKTLGLAPLDADGFLIDAWNNRVRYAVVARMPAAGAGSYSNASGFNALTDNVFTTKAALCGTYTPTAEKKWSAISGYLAQNYTAIPNKGLLHVCRAAPAGANIGLRCNAPTNATTPSQLTDTDATPAVVYSVGENGSNRGADEADNLNLDRTFVGHVKSDLATNRFDDVVTWVSLNTLYAKMLAAGQLCP